MNIDITNNTDKMWVLESSQFRWKYYYKNSLYLFFLNYHSCTLAQYEMSRGKNYRKPITILSKIFYSKIETEDFYVHNWDIDFLTLCSNLGVTITEDYKEVKTNKLHPFIDNKKDTFWYLIKDGIFHSVSVYKDYDVINFNWLQWESPRCGKYNLVKHEYKNETLESARGKLILVSHGMLDELLMEEVL